MKKLLLTGVTAALFSFAAMGQQRDSVQNGSNQYRQSDQQQQNPAAVDSSSIYDNQDQQQSDQNLQQQPSNEFNQNANDLRDSVNQNDMERPSNQLQQNSEQPQDMQQGVPQNNDNLNSQPDNQQTDSNLNEMNDQFRSAVEGNQSNMQAPDVEVVKDKEGPDNQVVYKYQGDLYYVDREKKELVKAKESDLQNAEHDVIIDQGGSESASNNR